VVSDEFILPWLERVREDLPGLQLFDVHTHIGANDPDDYRCSPEDLLEALEVAGARAVVFPMHEPGGYPAANDMVIREAAAAEGRLVPFCRLDPRSDPVAEAERCLGAGARGIKLHPRAEGFTLDEPAVADIVALAHERRVCVLIHAGRGIPALGRHSVDLCERFPDARLILAHAGISDLAWIWGPAAGLPNLFFDTAWWTPDDLLALFAMVPPGQILLGSDAPYGSPALGATLPLRYALQAGLSAEQVEWVFGRQLERLLAGEDRRDLGGPPGPGSLTRDPLLARVYSFLVSALGQMLRGLEPEEALALAQLACEVGDDAPQAGVCSSILALIEERTRYAARPDPAGPPRFAPGIHLVLIAACVCRTPDVPQPPDPIPVDVGERAAGR
jgi:predicted TIM-barrel fold metal-dependent hydrolase